MANELKHVSVGTQLTQAEYEAITGHQFDAQATGDIAYASSATQIRRLGIGSTGQPLTVVGGVPAWGGDVALGANKLTTTNLALIEKDAGALSSRDAADTVWAGFRGTYFSVQSRIEAEGSGVSLDANNADAATWIFRARDTGVGLVDVARLVGAADPYFQMTLAMRLNPIATASLPAAPVEGMLVYDDTAKKLKVRVAAAWETVTSA